MAKKNDSWNNFGKPILVLVIICFVVTFALAMTYGITQPIIERNTKAAADAARQELLPDADSFREYEGEKYVLEDGKVYVVDAYTANNGAGMVITAKSSSYGGLLTCMVGIDKNGDITNVKVTEHSDTPGVGTKAQTPEHLAQYSGLHELQSENVKADSSVKYVTGASVTSSAVHKAVYAALEQYKEMGGVN